MIEKKVFNISRLIILTLLILIICFNDTHALAASSQESEEKGKNSGYVFLPILSYSPETKLAGGVVLNVYYRPSDADALTRPSNLMPTFIYTQQQQISVEMPTELYWHDELYYLNGYIGFAKFPDKFYGIGNDTKEENEENYTPRLFQIRSNVQRKITAHTYMGLQYNMKYHKILSAKDGGLLAGNGIAGQGAGTASGLGVSLTRDTRNNVFYPSAGTLLKIAAQRFDGMIGSDYDFTQLSTDIRGYFEPFRSHVIAVNGYANFMTTSPPFHMLSLLGQVGERNVMRGYYQGRYRDNNILVLQTEYRMPLWWRFGCAAFGGIGDVSHTISAFSVNRLKYSYGFGLRFQLDPKENINLRLDFGFGKESSGFYLAIGEAF